MFLARFSSLRSHRNFPIRSGGTNQAIAQKCYRILYEAIISIVIIDLSRTSCINIAYLLTLVHCVLIPRIISPAQWYTSGLKSANHRLGISIPLEAWVNEHTSVGRYSIHIQEKRFWEVMMPILLHMIHSTWWAEKGKTAPVLNYAARHDGRGEGRTCPRIFNLYPWEAAPGTHQTKREVGFQADMNTSQKQSLMPTPGIERIIGRPARSHYTDKGHTSNWILWFTSAHDYN